MIVGLLYISVALLIAVFFHELAHMIVALLCGVKVKAFVIGFGKPFIHKKIWGIDFGIAVIPLGGYCRLEGEKSKVKERENDKIDLKLIKIKEISKIKSDKSYVDDAIVKKSDKDTVVATSDRELKRRLKKKGIKIIFLKKKQFLALE